MTTLNERTEWLEADGIGGFASGTVSGPRTRRYHALLLAATTPPTGRMVLVNGFDAWITTSAGRFAISTQRYEPDVLHPDGYRRIASFTTEPWPTWEFDTPDGVRMSQEVVVRHGGTGCVLSWRLVAGAGPIILEVRPFLSGRDYHSTHHENSAFDFTPEINGNELVWRPYQGIPAIHASTTGAYAHAPEWYRNFLYAAERERGLDDVEDLASPGVFTWTLDNACDEAVLIFSAGESTSNASRVTRGFGPVILAATDVDLRASEMRAAERQRRSAFPTPLDRAADAYLVQRGNGRSIVAGYPWFTDWGRDTFIAIRGLCITTGRLTEARDILLEWSSAISRGMLPNRFPDAGEFPEFNAVDASLWFIIAVHDLLQHDRRGPSVVSSIDRARLDAAVREIVVGYSAGTRYGIRAESDGLLRAGEPGVQLTWMDARVGDRVITPRIGKPVEVQALWLNAVWIAAAIDADWWRMFEAGRRTFARRFWNAERSCLYDVVDVDHAPGTVDATVRPNQIFAVGGLPVSLLDDARARLVVDVVERELLTPYGLRSLARSERGYAPQYRGGPAERDSVYHQGTVWPWLLGAFVEAWVRVRGGTEESRKTARERFIAPLLQHVGADGAGHLCEIADAEPPFAARGCPFQAWSLGELLRVSRGVMAPASAERTDADVIEVGR